MVKLARIVRLRLSLLGSLVRVRSLGRLRLVLASALPLVLQALVQLAGLSLFGVLYGFVVEAAFFHLFLLFAMAYDLGIIL